VDISIAVRLSWKPTKINALIIAFILGPNAGKMFNLFIFSTKEVECSEDVERSPDMRNVPESIHGIAISIFFLTSFVGSVQLYDGLNVRSLSY